MSLERCLQIIRETAKVPSFSSYEEVLHPQIISIASKIEGCSIFVESQRNLVLFVPGKEPGLVALTAHLDKINHFGVPHPAELPFERNETYLKGQLDNTAGIGVVMALLEEAPTKSWPDMIVLLSEMEESTGLKNHPEWMRNGGKELFHGMGAERLSHFLRKKQWIPDAVITIDTTPLFKGDPGCAVYSKHWEFTGTTPTEAEITATEILVKEILNENPDILHRNNTNDYLTYGKILNQLSDKPVPSIAIEPAIFPYHTKDEQVYVKDLQTILTLVSGLLDRWTSIRKKLNH